jgi:hypothetical protein
MLLGSQSRCEWLLEKRKPVLPAWTRTPDRPARGLLLYRVRYSGFWIEDKNVEWSCKKSVLSDDMLLIMDRVQHGILHIAQKPIVGHGPFVIGSLWSHSDTPLSVGLLRMGDQSGAETYPWHTQHSQQTGINALVGFEPAIPASEWLQTHVLDRAATGFGFQHSTDKAKYMGLQQIVAIDWRRSWRVRTIHNFCC